MLPAIPVAPPNPTAEPRVLPETPLAPPANGYRIWGSAEFMLWWIKNGPQSNPLVTTGNPTDAVPGALGQPGTRVLFGNSPLNYGAIPGGQFTLGAWLTPEQTVGIEGSGFLLARQSVNFSAASDAVGNPPLYFPFHNAVTNQQGSVVIADPVNRGFPIVGAVAVSSESQLWGAELNGVFLVWSERPRGIEFDLLAGFRYVDLLETEEIANTSNGIGPGNVFNNTLLDHFETRNQFYGGQIGGRLRFVGERLSATITAKLALGASHETVNVNGFINQSGPNAAPAGMFPSGLYTQASNVGRITHDQFSVIPELQAKIDYKLFRNTYIFGAYNFLYWNQVVRPGSQINPNLNLSQSPVFGGTGGVLAGPSQPAPLFSHSDFWAQGVTVGLEFRY